MALPHRRPAPALIWHSDQGTQFVSLAFGHQARAAGITQSMGSRGDCFDNAVAESFFVTLKKELIRGRSWPSKAELRTAVFEYIEIFFNRRRGHSTLRDGLARAVREKATSSQRGPSPPKAPCPPTRGDSTPGAALRSGGPPEQSRPRYRPSRRTLGVSRD
jgi:transposase InsO family protein